MVYELNHGPLELSIGRIMRLKLKEPSSPQIFTASHADIMKASYRDDLYQIGFTGNVLQRPVDKPMHMFKERITFV